MAEDGFLLSGKTVERLSRAVSKIEHLPVRKGVRSRWPLVFPEDGAKKVEINSDSTKIQVKDGDELEFDTTGCFEGGSDDESTTGQDDQGFCAEVDMPLNPRDGDVVPFWDKGGRADTNSFNFNINRTSSDTFQNGAKGPWKWNVPNGAGEWRYFGGTKEWRLKFQNEGAPNIWDVSGQHIVWLDCEDNLTTSNVINKGTGDDCTTPATTTDALNVSPGMVGDSFDISKSSIRINSFSRHELFKLDTFSWFVWIRPESIHLAQSIISLGDTDAANYVRLQNVGGGKLSAQLVIGGAGQWRIDISTTTLSNGVKTHVGIRHDGVKASLFQDGVIATSSFVIANDLTAVIKDIPGLDNGRIGSQIDSGVGETAAWAGEMDDIRMGPKIDLTFIPEIFNNDNGTPNDAGFF